jgi:hypothetical protein
MKNKLTFILIMIPLLFVNAQIYTPNGVIEGSSGNNYIGIGTSVPKFNLSLFGANTGTYTQFVHSGTGNSSNDGFIIGVGANNQGVFLNRENSGIEFYTNDTRRVYIGSDGNFGIGTKDPLQKFVVSNNGAEGFELYLNGDGLVGLQSYNRTLKAYAKMQLDASQFSFISGNVGIGTADPFYKLDVKGTISSDRLYVGKLDIVNDGTYETTINSGGVAKIDMGFDGAKGYIKFGAHTGSGQRDNILYLRGSDGNVGIGTTTPDSQLTVNGTIHSKEVKVDLNVWPDFVFKKEYNLPTLENVEKHINEKGHLENIPSEEEVLKNGISLGEMNSKLLQKIEELTLYMIEMKKRNDQQTMELDKSKKEIELLRKENNSFKNISDRLLQIEKKLK